MCWPRHIVSCSNYTWWSRIPFAFSGVLKVTSELNQWWGIRRIRLNQLHRRDLSRLAAVSSSVGWKRSKWPQSDILIASSSNRTKIYLFDQSDPTRMFSEFEPNFLCKNAHPIRTFLLASLLRNVILQWMNCELKSTWNLCHKIYHLFCRTGKI